MAHMSASGTCLAKPELASAVSTYTGSDDAAEWRINAAHSSSFTHSWGAMAQESEQDVKCGAVKAYSDELSQANAGANGAHRMKGAMKIVGLSLHVDSDNTTNIAEYPDSSKGDLDTSEDAQKHVNPVHILYNAQDDDANLIPGFADGYGANSAANTGHHWERAIIKATETTGVSIKFNYKASDPNGVSFTNRKYIVSPGLVRLWKKDGPSARDSGSADSGGDYIKPDTYVLLSSLSKIGENYVIYIEGVRPTGTDAIGITFKQGTNEFKDSVKYDLNAGGSDNISNQDASHILP